MQKSISEADADRIRQFMVERCNRPEWKQMSRDDQTTSNFLARIVSVLGFLWLAVLVIGVLYHSLLLGGMLIITLCYVWNLFKVINEHTTGPLMQALAAALKDTDHTQRLTPPE